VRGLLFPGRMPNATWGCRATVSYSVHLAPQVLRYLQALTKTARKRLSPAISSLADDPRPPGCKKLKGRHGLYRVRVGDYRIIYSVDDNIQVVLVVKAGDRKDVYD